MLEIIRGDSRVLLVTVYTDSTLVSRQDLANVAEARFSGRQPNEAGALIFQRTLGDGDITITDATEGEMEIQLEAADTTALPARPTRLAYDLELTWADGQVTTVELGTMLVRPDVSY